MSTTSPEGALNDDRPDFSTMTPEAIKAYADQEGQRAYDAREELLRGAEITLGSWSPANARRRVRAGILHTANLMTEEEYQKAIVPIHVGPGFTITM